MKNFGISYIVPLRGRKEMIPGFIHNIRKYNKDFEIIFCCQDDNLLFRKGQLSNLGYKRSTKNLVSFINIDYRFLEFVPIVEEMEKEDTPLIPFLYATKVREDPEGNLIELIPRGRSQTPGGCQVFNRKQFEKSGGHTNLILGWGIDDVVLNHRVCKFSTFRHLPYCMGHVKHDKFVEYPQREYVKSRNTKVSVDPPSDLNLDSFRETIAKEFTEQQIGDGIFRLGFKNIGVPKDFSEMKRYQQQLKMEREVLSI